jgi:hypothetical protein
MYVRHPEKQQVILHLDSLFEGNEKVDNGRIDRRKNHEKKQISEAYLNEVPAVGLLIQNHSSQASRYPEIECELDSS